MLLCRDKKQKTLANCKKSLQSNSMGNPGVQPPGSTLEPLGSTLELPGSTLELLSSWLELLGGKVKMTSVKCSNFFLSQNSRMLLGVAF